MSLENQVVVACRLGNLAAVVAEGNQDVDHVGSLASRAMTGLVKGLLRVGCPPRCALGMLLGKQKQKQIKFA